MSHLGKTLRRAAFAILLIAAAANAQNPSPTPAAEQRPHRCGGINYVAASPANPFSATHTTKATTTLPDGTKQLTEFVEFVARDSDGRIRFEKHGGLRPAGGEQKVILHTHDGGQKPPERQWASSF
jgi:hypothetical protein